MEMESNKISEDLRLMEVITNIAGEIEKLGDLPKALADLENRISSIEKRSDEEESILQNSIASSGNALDGDLELKDVRISELESHLAILESPEHRENLILEWLHNLDQDSYYSLGVRKGYMEEINPETQSPLGNLKDPSPEVIFSQEQPEDMTGWAYSNTLNCYIKLEGGMLV
jgi:hypothetical protein